MQYRKDNKIISVFLQNKKVQIEFGYLTKIVFFILIHKNIDVSTKLHSQSSKLLTANKKLICIETAFMWNKLYNTLR